MCLVDNGYAWSRRQLLTSITTSVPRPGGNRQPRPPGCHRHPGWRCPLRRSGPRLIPASGGLGDQDVAAGLVGHRCWAPNPGSAVVPRIPLLPTTMRSAPTVVGHRTITSAGSPTSVWISVSMPSTPPATFSSMLWAASARARPADGSETLAPPEGTATAAEVWTPTTRWSLAPFCRGQLGGQWRRPRRPCPSRRCRPRCLRTQCSPPVVAGARSDDGSGWRATIPGPGGSVSVVGRGWRAVSVPAVQVGPGDGALTQASEGRSPALDDGGGDSVAPSPVEDDGQRVGPGEGSGHLPAVVAGRDPWRLALVTASGPSGLHRAPDHRMVRPPHADRLPGRRGPPRSTVKPGCPRDDQGQGSGPEPVGQVAAAALSRRRPPAPPARGWPPGRAGPRRPAVLEREQPVHRPGMGGSTASP